MRSQYKYLVTSPEAFVQRIAVNLIPYGYWFYTASTIPERKDPLAVDEKLIGYYGLAVGRWVREQQKRDGIARVQYVRHDRFQVLIATHGRHQFFEDEKAAMRDIRTQPLKYGGYSISFRNGHTSVRMDLRAYRELKAKWVKEATFIRNPEWWERRFMAFPYASYAPIRRQAFNILRAVNRRRGAAGLPIIGNEFVRIKRKSLKCFEAPAQ